MGVPTLTLAGGTLLSRQGASLLTAAGLRDWVATSVQDYQRKAIAFAGNPAALAQLRARLREMARQSPLFDGAVFARHFEAALLSIWRKRWTAVHESNGEHHEHAD